MVRRLRLYSGLVLFAYVVSHLVNHAAGLWSLAAMEAVLQVVGGVWRSPPGTLLLYGAFIVHMALAFWALFRRRRLAMPLSEALQLLLGLLLPPLLALHVVGTRMVSEVFASDTGFSYILAIYFELAPQHGIKQAAVLLIAWIHACIGLHLWLRLKPWYAGVQAPAFAGALLLPTLALLGVWSGGREMMRLFDDPAWTGADALLATINDPDKLALINRVEPAFVSGFLVLLLATLAARGLRRWLEHRHGRVVVAYPDGRRVPVPLGASILDASRGTGIPHAALCGGRGRCSTCRVRIGVGLEALAPPSEEEQRVLRRVGMPPNVRLACQTRPTTDVEVTPLLPANVSPRAAVPRPGQL